MQLNTKKNKQPSQKVSRRPKQSFLQRRHTDEQQTHEKMLNIAHYSIQFSSFQSLSCVRLFVTPWIAAHQASLSITDSRSSPKLMSIESVMPSSHLILCHPLLLPAVPPSIRVFSNESTLRMRWPKYWSFSLSISPSNAEFQRIARRDKKAFLSNQCNTYIHIYPFFRFFSHRGCSRVLTRGPGAIQ